MAKDKVKRRNQVEALKQRRLELLAEIGLTKSNFKRKMPKVIGKGADFEVADPRKIDLSKNKAHVGKKPSLVQQVIYLSELAEATREIREEFKKEQEKAEQEKENAKE